MLLAAEKGGQEDCQHLGVTMHKPSESCHTCASANHDQYRVSTTFSKMEWLVARLDNNQDAITFLQGWKVIRGDIEESFAALDCSLLRTPQAGVQFSKWYRRVDRVLSKLQLRHCDQGFGDPY